MKNNKRKDQPVAIVDMDDVIARFRDGFSSWIQKKHGVKPNVLSKEYYFIEDLKSNQIDPDQVFSEFISDSGFLSLSLVDDAANLLKTLREKGYWIHILTARPGDNEKCTKDTLLWLESNNLDFDMLSFSGNKLEWCQRSTYSKTDSIAFAIDDSPKHAEKYSKNGFLCYVPKKTYNGKVWSYENVITYDSLKELIEKIK